MEKLICPNCGAVCRQQKIVGSMSREGLPDSRKIVLPAAYHYCTGCEGTKLQKSEPISWNFIVLSDYSFWEYKRRWIRRKDKPRFQYLMY